MIVYNYSSNEVTRILALYVTGLLASVTALSMITAVASLGVFW
jgi:hypothetical protein